MATRTISVKLAIDGEAEYRQSVANINNALKTLKSELALVESQFQREANSQEALTAKKEVLNRQLDLQTKKLKETRAALENAKKAQDQHTASVEAYKSKISAAEQRLEELKSSTGDTAKEQAKLTAKLKEYQSAQESAKVKEDAAKKGVEDWQRKVNYAERDLNVLNGKIKDNAKYLEEAENATDRQATSIDQFGKKTNQAAKELKNANEVMNAMAAALAAAGITRGLREIVEAMKACVDASVDFESAMAGVFKTVDGTDAQLAAISDGIKQMSTEIPATTTEIAAVAEAAGQLGIATDDVLAFSRVMLDLGESTNMTADEAATALARFANITGTSASDYERLGSVIVGLGNNFATTEKEITEMSTRLASSGTLAGLTEPEIMALATAMSSVGIEAEAGGTAMTQTLTAMEKAVAGGGENLERFARIAGMSASEFSSAWENDAITAIQSFITGLGKLDEQGESATLILDEMGLSGVRQSNMLKSLALASDTLTGAVGLANQAWEENTALTDEANKRYETTESKLAMMSNAFDNVKAAIGDALAPALREMADAGTDAFSWAAEFIEKNPWLVQALSGVTAGITALTVGITGYTAVTKYGKIVTEAFNLTLSKCPAVFVASAIIALITAVGAYAASAKKASEKNRELTDSLKESRDAYEESISGIQKESDNILSAVSALESLASVEVKSAAQKQVMADLVDQLNQSVPNLSLAYDAQTDSLNMTTESIRELAQAQAEQQLRAEEVERLTALYVEQEKITEDLSAARYQLEEAQAALNAMVEDGTYGAMGYETASIGVDRAVVSASKSVKELTEAQDDNQAEIDALIKKTETYETQTNGLTAQTEALTKAENMLNAALVDQETQGQLTAAAMQELIDAGYESALVIDKETGAVHLNKEAFIQAAKAKIDEQIETLSAKKASAEAKIALLDEARAANDAAIAYYNKAKAVRNSKHESKDSLEVSVSAYDKEIAALQQSKISLDSYAKSSTDAARTSAAGSRKMQTQAEKDLAKYKELRSALDHSLAMGEITEKAYYEALALYRDQYLTDDSNLSEYRKINEEIHKYDQKLAEDEKKLWEEQTKSLVSELEDRTKAILDEQSRMQEKLAGYGDLFTIKDDVMSLDSIQKQTEAIRTYGSTLQQLKDKGVTGSLLDEIIGMGVDDATEYGAQLLAMDPEDLTEYIAAWEEKQAEAKQVAEQFYQDQIDALGTEYNDKLGETLGELTGTAFLSGQDTVQGLIDGLKDKEPELYAYAKTMADEISRILSSAYSTSGGVDGSHVGGLPYVPFDGYIAKLHQGERVLTKEEAQAYIVRSIPRDFDIPTTNRQPDVGSMLTQAVNAIAMNQGPVASGDLIVEIPVDGEKFYRATIKDFRRVSRANPEVRA